MKTKLQRSPMKATAGTIREMTIRRGPAQSVVRRDRCGGSVCVMAMEFFLLRSNREKKQGSYGNAALLC
jgi:hypothetical protein